MLLSTRVVHLPKYTMLQFGHKTLLHQLALLRVAGAIIGVYTRRISPLRSDGPKEVIVGGKVVSLGLVTLQKRRIISRERSLSPMLASRPAGVDP